MNAKLKKLQAAKRLQALEAKMTAFMKDKGDMPTDEEMRELCLLRTQVKKQK